MRIVLIAIGALVLATTGCARNYTMRLNNGVEMTSQGKPKLQGGYYVFKDARGQQRSIPQGRVSMVGPSSRVAQDKAVFKPQPVR